VTPFFCLALAAGLIGLRRAIRGAGHLRHPASAADHPFLVDRGAAGFSPGVSRVRRAWPRRQTAELVRHRAVAADAAGGCGGNYVARPPIFAAYDDTDPTVRAIIVSYSTNMLVTLLTALVCFRFLRQLEFDVRQAMVGVLALLLSTTHLHYTQNMMENNYIFLLTLTGFSFQYEWLRSGSRRALLLGSCAFGLNLLTRPYHRHGPASRRSLPSAGRAAGKNPACLAALRDLRRNRCASLLVICVPRSPLPVPSFWVVLQHLPGSGCSRAEGAGSIASPRLSVQHAFPHRLFGAALIAPEKSIFLFDPLLLLMLLLCVLAWKRFSPVVKAYTLTSGVLLLAYISFYARVAVLEWRLRLGRPLCFDHR